MVDLIFAQKNNRELNFQDKIFGINGKAQEMIAREGADKVVNATVGSILNDHKKLAVMDSVIKGMKDLEPEDYSAYAPIAGLPAFLDVIKKYAFGSHMPNMYTEACATPGGTGALRMTISNYSQIGDAVLTSDWYWAPYKTIATEIGRKLETYTLFDHKGGFNMQSFGDKIGQLLTVQDSLVVILNTPAHNPTGYSVTDAEWDEIIAILKEKAGADKRITLLVDAAYIDFAGDPEECRAFLPKFESMPDNILTLYAFSASKTFCLYGMRCGALICMTNNKAICDEFKNVCTFSARATWSNCTRASQQLIVNIYNDKDLNDKVDEERAGYRELLLERGRVFAEAAKACGLETVPFSGGFFASIPCADSEAVGELMHKEGVFLVPLAKGLRVALSGVSAEKCAQIPAIIKKSMDEYYEKK